MKYPIRYTISRKVNLIILVSAITSLLHGGTAGPADDTGRAGEQTPLVIAGRVISEVRGEPLPFATVTLTGSYFGTATNSNGTFRLVLQSYAPDDTLKFSCLGFETLLVPIEYFVCSGINGITLELKPQLYSIDEVFVSAKRERRRSAYSIVKDAIAMINANYPRSPFLIDGYYRDYLKNSEGYTNLFEARIHLEDMGFHENDYHTSRMRVLSGGMNQGFRIDSSMIISYTDPGVKRIPAGEINYRGGNELAILRLVDPVRNPDRNTVDYINILRKNFLQNHTFWHEGVAYLDGSAVYKIGFKTKPSRQDEIQGNVGSSLTLGTSHDRVEGRAEGEIFVDGESFLILKLNYLVNANDRVHGDFRIWELNEEYRLVDGVPFLQYLSYNNAVEFPDYSDSAYFFLENIIIDHARERIGLEFNNPVDTAGLRRDNICKIKNGDMELEFYAVSFSDTIIYLYPEEFRKIFPLFSPQDPGNLDIRMRRVRDVYGNLFEEYKFLTFYQYRELFVRDVLTNYSPLSEGVPLNSMNSIVFSDYAELTPQERDYFNSEGLKSNK